MKQCPVCKSIAFDDAATCFGCLHKFSDEDPVIADLVSASAEDELALADAPPSFVIRIKPKRERSGLVSWTCAVDLLPT